MPVGDALANGFRVEHARWQEVLDVENGVGVWREIALPRIEPSTWDGPHDSEYWRVSFLTFSTLERNALSCAFAPGVVWEENIEVIAKRWSYQVLPPEIHFTKGSSQVTLDPFEVVRREAAFQEFGTKRQVGA